MTDLVLFPDYVDMAAQREVAKNRYRFILDAMCTSEGAIDIDYIDSEICKILGRFSRITVQSFEIFPEDKLLRINRMLEAAVTFINNDPSADLDEYMVYNEALGLFEPEDELW